MSAKYARRNGVCATLVPLGRQGYYKRVDIDGKYVSIHRLVLEAFIGPCPKGHCANHKNGKKDDNRIENLEWVTFSENSKHNFKIGLQCNKGENHSRHILTEDKVREIRMLRKNGVPIKEVGKIFGIGIGHVSAICHRRLWPHVQDILSTN